MPDLRTSIRVTGYGPTASHHDGSGPGWYSVGPSESSDVETSEEGEHHEAPSLVCASCCANAGPYTYIIDPERN